MVVAGLAVGLVALGSQSQAQAPEEAEGAVGFRGGGSRNSVPLWLLSRPEVRKELKITAEQMEQMDQAREATKEEAREQLGDMQKRIANAEGPRAVSAIRATIRSMRAEEEEAVTQFLSRAQWTRLRQIALQKEGPLAVARPDVQEELSFTPDQSAAIRMIIDELNEARTELSRSVLEKLSQASRPTEGNVGREVKGAKKQGPQPQKKEDNLRTRIETMQQRSAQAEQRAIREIARVLTKSQKQQFNKLLGKPFKDGPQSGQGVPGATSGIDTKAKAATATSPTPTSTGRSERRPRGLRQ